MSIKLPEHATVSQLYDPTTRTDLTQEQADEYFEALVNRAMASGLSRTNAEQRERDNIGYYAGYCGTETQQRVSRLFAAQHPIIGNKSHA